MYKNEDSKRIVDRREMSFIGHIMRMDSKLMTIIFDHVYESKNGNQWFQEIEKDKD